MSTAVYHRQPIIPAYPCEPACDWAGLVKRWPEPIPSTIPFSELAQLAKAIERKRRLAKRTNPCR